MISQSNSPQGVLESSDILALDIEQGCSAGYPDGSVANYCVNFVREVPINCPALFPEVYARHDVFSQVQRLTGSPNVIVYAPLPARTLPLLAAHRCTLPLSNSSALESQRNNKPILASQRNTKPTIENSNRLRTNTSLPQLHRCLVLEPQHRRSTRCAFRLSPLGLGFVRAFCFAAHNKQQPTNNTHQNSNQKPSTIKQPNALAATHRPTPHPLRLWRSRTHNADRLD